MSATLAERESRLTLIVRSVDTSGRGNTYVYAHPPDEYGHEYVLHLDDFPEAERHRVQPGVFVEHTTHTTWDAAGRTSQRHAARILTTPDLYRALHVVLDMLEARDVPATEVADAVALAASATEHGDSAASLLAAGGWAATPHREDPRFLAAFERPLSDVRRHLARLARRFGPGPGATSRRLRIFAEWVETDEEEA